MGIYTIYNELLLLILISACGTTTRGWISACRTATWGEEKSEHSFFHVGGFQISTTSGSAHEHFRGAIFKKKNFGAWSVYFAAFKL